ncbi:VOC family protein [Colwellia psychrerythraea]|uniref:VOC domain-containing protein n=1 Tax=Colwellia psychrerythraea TaxID=28229 RepID=A0A099KUD0_COLPS|nr:hypothetical protein [Colwellia psychrerythraea]KGJ94111.1 hypothetical protein ND2E_2044 [Colwellia psychrerythraea]
MNINHVLVLTTDLRAMECFWVELIGLDEGKRPPFPFNGLWLYSDGNPLVHIAEQPFSAFGNGSIAHVALEGANYNALMKRLSNSAYSHTEKILPISNERQLFIIGPNGLTVEMLFPLTKSSELSEQKQTLVYETNEKFDFLGGKIL